MPNAVSNAPKKPVSFFYFKLLPKVTQYEKKEAKKPKSIKSRPNSPVASTSKDGVVRCPVCEEEFCDPITEEWIQFCKCQEWWHEECSNYENGIFICDYC
ncbi:uncharacterized protein TNCV_3294721 [Trichonephila clavipes]|nr:uncharacterized protein TNCV_3294721 [Trichonephila clavipes]